MAVFLRKRWFGIVAAVAIAAAGVGSLVAGSAPAEARVFIGLSVGVPGYYYPPPAYYSYAYPVYYGYPRYYGYPYAVYYGPRYYHHWRHWHHHHG